METVPSIAVIIPTWNEEGAIGGVIARIPRELGARVIVADGGSRDRTAEVARAHGAEVIDAGRGYGRACWLGALAAEGADILVYLDGDGSDAPEWTERLIAPIASGSADFVIVSRLKGEREPGSMSFHQIAAGWIIGWGVKALYGFRYTDMCAFRAIRRDTLLTLGMSEMTYGWNLEMQMKAARDGLRILEIGAPYARRAAGRSKVAGSVRGTVVAGARIILTFCRVAAQRRSSIERGLSKQELG
jgi:glycosyltransferase involved in cell wall biosynthesis